jgi:hypothetical protein
MAVTAAKVHALEGSLVRPRKAGGAVVVGNAAYNDSAGKLQKARANAAATSDAVGIIVAVNEPGETTAGDNEAVSLCTFGPVGGFSSLTPGAIYYVSDTTDGDILTPAPSGAGKWAKSIGYAESASVLFVAPGIAAARSSALA